MKARLGAPEALTATAHKLARILHHLIKDRCPYDPVHLRPGGGTPSLAANGTSAHKPPSSASNLPRSQSNG